MSWQDAAKLAEHFATIPTGSSEVVFRCGTTGARVYFNSRKKAEESPNKFKP